jgi:hypothetical protein
MNSSLVKASSKLSTTLLIVICCIGAGMIGLPIMSTIDLCHRHGIKLMSIDTHAVTATKSKGLDTHLALILYNMMCLENLDLSAIQESNYCVVPLPLKVMVLKTTPVPAVLLSFNKEESYVIPLVTEKFA